jgi:uncharacterized protein YdhG (YjbR/CyaY superfamily)
MAPQQRKPEGSSTAATKVRAYHASLSPTTRRHLKALEAEIRAAAPDATRAFRYRMPAFAIAGQILVWCAGWAQHVGMYPVTPAMQASGGAALDPYRHSKATLRFPLDQALPRALIRKVIRARVNETRNS